MKKNGFTLIELLLVFAIVGIISAIAIPAILGQKARKNTVSAESVMTENGPPDKVEKVADITFLYYKQTSGYYKIYTVKNDRIVNEVEKRIQ